MEGKQKKDAQATAALVVSTITEEQYLTRRNIMVPTHTCALAGASTPWPVAYHGQNSIPFLAFHGQKNGISTFIYF